MASSGVFSGVRVIELAQYVYVPGAGVLLADQFYESIPYEPFTPKSLFAALGYCMGGRYALSAVTASSRVKFAGAFHASNIAPAQGDSPHQRVAGTKGRIYIGVAGIDPTYGAEEHGRLAAALREADTDHVIETYHGMGHGWVFPDLAIYNAAGAAKHSARFKENLGELFA